MRAGNTQQSVQPIKKRKIALSRSSGMQRIERAKAKEFWFNLMHWGSKLRNSARHSCRNCNKVIKIILLNLGLPFELYVHEKKLSTRFLISFQNWQRAERISLYKRSRWYIMMADSTFYNLSIDLKALLLPNRCKSTTPEKHWVRGLCFYWRGSGTSSRPLQSTGKLANSPIHETCSQK